MPISAAASRFSACARIATPQSVYRNATKNAVIRTRPTTSAMAWVRKIATVPIWIGWASKGSPMKGMAAPTRRTISSAMMTSTPIVSSAREFWSAPRAPARRRSMSRPASAAPTMPTAAAAYQPIASRRT